MITTPLTADLLRGAARGGATPTGACVPHRLPGLGPRPVRPTRSWRWPSRQPSGVRLVLRTRATVVELDTLPAQAGRTPAAPPRPDGVYDLLVDGRLTDPAASPRRRHAHDRHGHRGRRAPARPPPPPSASPGCRATPRTSRSGCPTTRPPTLVALRTDAPVEPAPDRRPAVWLHHGSSISHGSDAASPTTTWPALAAASSPAWSWSTSASAAARCSTRSRPASCATPLPT